MNDKEDLLDEIAAGAARRRLFAGVDRLLVGASGGGDSTALLDVLARLAPRLGMRLAVAHLHHGWRGADADADRDLAGRQASRHGLPFFCAEVDLRDAPGSREAAARDARRGFFADVAGRWRADAVALGHTADDQLETVVLHLARGAGRRGFGGMRPRARLDGLLYVRPLLGRRRAELRDYARARSLPWNEDSSNRDISLARNRLRRRMLGELQQIHPAAVDNVARAAALLQEEEEWLESLAAQALEGLSAAGEHPGSVVLAAAGLAELPLPLQRRVVRRAIVEVRGHCRDIGFEHVEWVVDAERRAGKKARDLPGVRVQVDQEEIRLLPLNGRRVAEPSIA